MNRSSRKLSAQTNRLPAFIRRQWALATAAMTLFSLPASALAQPFTIDWHTVDGGGAVGTTDGVPGGLELSGTIGQHDASNTATPMTGAAFELVGGFWPVVQVCYCPGDLNHDGEKNGEDIQAFVNCILQGGDCTCADVNQVGGINIGDVAPFVADLLTGAACP